MKEVLSSHFEPSNVLPSQRENHDSGNFIDNNMVFKWVNAYPETPTFHWLILRDTETLIWKLWNFESIHLTKHYQVTVQRRIKIFLLEYSFSKGFRGKSPNRHNHELWRIIFDYKHVRMTYVGVTYCGKCNYYVFIDYVRLVFWESSLKITWWVLVFYQFGIPYRLNGCKAPLDTSLLFRAHIMQTAKFLSIMQKQQFIFNLRALRSRTLLGQSCWLGFPRY